MPSWSEFQPFIVIGLAAGGVYALSAVGIVVLYRATGVLNLAFGAIGGVGALIAWSMINSWHWPSGVAYVACVLFGGVATLAYGTVFGRLLAATGPARQGRRHARPGAAAAGCDEPAVAGAGHAFDQPAD